MTATDHLINHCVQNAWWQYEFPNGHDAMVWVTSAPFRFSMESSDTTAGRLLPETAGLYYASNLTTDQVEERLALLAALPQKEN